MKTIKNIHIRTHTKRILSKNLFSLFALLLMTSILATSCDPTDDSDSGSQNEEPPTAQEFKNIRDIALNNHTQLFNFNTEDVYISLISENGVQINLNANCLTDNGNPVSGDITLEYIEIFEKGSMLTTNKPTMGKLPNGDKALIITGGEFFIEVTQNGTILDTNCGLQLVIPTSLTGGSDPDMSLWTGEMDADGNLAWDEVEDNTNGDGGLFLEGENYYGILEGFGWTNVDKFYNDPRPKTTLQVQPPAGYNNQNSAIYLSYDGELPALAQLDTYDETLNLFSEHYGQIPIGLECHVIFVSESDGEWRYSIKPVTIVANEIITFYLGETTVRTEASLTALINDLP
ncbi:hypothetical protein ADIWIN_2194 [Winogradskyella psychrotolerans RS-3]|uniref:Lipoprotein n=1 Tax=Winogradskyella psychrotolerans RS-3 TaxID=641526 RepID=S7VS73_9FLAO|nr:hypothetical protein [Winogradskyella psychrotolerans]EPR72871.1 hypothetical protein ADIWIN_2194 [Winogradskyella psychrotolerans RS-3]